MTHATSKLRPGLQHWSNDRRIGGIVGGLLVGLLGCSSSGNTTAGDASTADTIPATTTTTATTAVPATDASGTTATPTTGGSASASGGSSGSETSSSGDPPTTSTTTASTGDASTGDPSTGTTSTASTSGGQLCIDRGGSCADGERCCAGLDCCIGIPVPRGEEFCSEMCPKSDRNSKTEFRPIDHEQVLQGVVQLPISTWRYRGDRPDVRHLGPMAQDFRATFGLWDTDTKIFALDASGVALAAIQGLYARVTSLADENTELRKRIETLEQRFDQLAPASPN